MRAVVFWGLFVACAVPVAAQGDRERLAPEIVEALAALTETDGDRADVTTRRRLVQRVLAEPAAWEALERFIDERLEALERGYARMLEEPVRAAYRRRVRELTDAEVREVAAVRRVWRPYVLSPTTQLHFQQHFLRPATSVGGLLLPDAAAIETKESKAQLREMREFAGYRAEVREAAGLGDDPTTGKFAPTGIPLPPLDRVRTYDEHLDHLHRSIAVAASVAPAGAWDILIGNAIQARFIDYEEAEFVLYANEIRALMGVVCWSTDVLACAATRDHSKDRVDGNAKGHFSNLPGKRGFVDRLRRFGTSGTSEGAGGGNSGRNYLHGLSYGGGHTGPLYSMKRNRVGVGRFGNCYTSVYGLDKRRLHPCQVSAGELFMPPGLGLDDVDDPVLKDACYALQFENHVGARQLLQKATPKTKTDRFVRDYLLVAIEVEADWQLECLARVAAVGDLYGVQRRIEQVRAKFADALDKRLRPYEKRLATRAASELVAAGRAYAAAVAAKDRAAIQAIVDDHAETVYASAAKKYLADTEGGSAAHPRSWFLGADRYLARFEYLTETP